MLFRFLIGMLPRRIELFFLVFSRLFGHRAFPLITRSQFATSDFVATLC